MNDNEIEVWKDIPGYEKEYQVSDFGNIRSIKLGKIKNLGLRLDITKKYRRVFLRKRGKKGKDFKLHEIIMLSFFGPNHLNIMHKDSNMLNNKLNNLEYCSIPIGLYYNKNILDDNINETWKDIPDYDGYYQISNLGNIKSLKNEKITIIKPGINKYGYYQASLYKNKNRKTHLVHRLVLLAFIGPNNLGVNHKDLNKLNNKLENLEYCTILENNRHAIKNGKISSGWLKPGEANRTSKYKTKQIIKVREMYSSKKYSYKEISIATGVAERQIWYIATGMKWKFVGGPISPKKKESNNGCSG